MSLTSEQKKLRLGRIGSSQIAALVGLSKFSRPIGVFREATEPDYEREPNELLEIGTLLEPVVLELYRRRTGRFADGGWTLTSDRWPFAAATPDAFSSQPDAEQFDRVIEAKTCLGFSASEWGERTDDVPPAYLIQTQWQMGLSREAGFPIESADVPVLIGGFDFRIYSVPFDAALFESLLTVAEKFWREHILTKTPPPIDGSQAYADFLKDRFPTHTREELLSASERHEALMLKLREAEVQAKAAKDRMECLKNELRAEIGDAPGIKGSLGHITYKADKRGVRAFKPNWRDEA